MADIQKMIEEIKGMTVIELNNLVKAIEEEFGVSAAAPVAVAAGPAAGPAAEEQTEFAVSLDSFDAAKKIAVIKVVKAALGVGLGDAKALVEGAPKVLKEGMSKADADKLIADLKEAGGVASKK